MNIRIYIIIAIFLLSEILYFQNTQQSNISNIVAILMGIFTALITFISILFVYFNFFNKSNASKLLDILYKIENFTYIFVNVEAKQKNNTFHKETYFDSNKNSFQYLKSFISEYNYEYNKLNKKNKFLKNLLYFNITVTILAICVIIISLYIINFYPKTVIVLLPAILIYNLYLTKQIIEFDNDTNLFPTPKILLTPTESLNEQFCNIYCLNKHLPSNIFHVATSFYVAQIKDLPEELKSNYYKDNKYSSNKDNYIMMYSLFPFTLDALKLTYSSTLNKCISITAFIYPTTDNGNITLSVYNRQFIKFPIINAYNENRFDDNITISILKNHEEICTCYYQLARNISNPGYCFYAPTHIFFNDSKTSSEIEKKNFYTE